MSTASPRVFFGGVIMIRMLFPWVSEVNWRWSCEGVARKKSDRSKQLRTQIISATSWCLILMTWTFRCECPQHTHVIAFNGACVERTTKTTPSMCLAKRDVNATWDARLRVLHIYSEEVAFIWRIWPTNEIIFECAIDCVDDITTAANCQLDRAGASAFKNASDSFVVLWITGMARKSPSGPGFWQDPGSCSDEWFCN